MTDANDSNADTLRPWHRRQWDTDASYRAFRDFYLPLTPPRSTDRAYAESRQEVVRKSSRRAPPCWSAWAAGHRWNGRKSVPVEDSLAWSLRAAAWDDHKRREAEVAEVVENTRFFIELHQGARAVAEKIMGVILSSLDTDKVATDTPAGAKALIDSVIKLAEFVKGERLAQPVTGRDGEPVKHEHVHKHAFDAKWYRDYEEARRELGVDSPAPAEDD